MTMPSFLRHSGSVDPASLRTTLNIVGCGAVGSHVALQAARMGWTRFRIWDFDKVEDFNLPNQAYMPQHIGWYKVDALKALLYAFNPDIKVEVHEVPFTSAEHKVCLDGPLVIATDSMSTRKDITEAFAYNSKIPAVLEARLGFDYGEVHYINPLEYNDLTAWRASLCDDSKIPDGPCNLRICPTLVGIISNVIVQYLCLPYASQRGGRGTTVPPFRQKFLMKDILFVRHQAVPESPLEAELDLKSLMLTIEEETQEVIEEQEEVIGELK